MEACSLEGEVEEASSSAFSFQEESTAETPLLWRGVLVKSAPNSELHESLHLPEVIWGDHILLRDRKLSPQEEEGLFRNFSSLVSKEAPRARPRAQLSLWAKVEEGAHQRR